MLHLGHEFGAYRRTVRFSKFAHGHKFGPHLGTDGIQFGLLLGIELQGADQPFALGSQTSAALPACRLGDGAGYPGPGAGITGAGARRSSSRSGRRCSRWLDPGDTHPHRCVRYLEHAFTRVGDDPNIGRHARQQTPAGVGETHYGDIGHHVGNGLRCLSHLAYRTLEGLTRKRIDREGGSLPDADAPYVTFVHTRVHLHVGQILRNHKQLGRLQAGRNGLALFDGTLDHDAIHR